MKAGRKKRFKGFLAQTFHFPQQPHQIRFLRQISSCTKSWWPFRTTFFSLPLSAGVHGLYSMPSFFRTLDIMDHDSFTHMYAQTGYRCCNITHMLTRTRTFNLDQEPWEREKKIFIFLFCKVIRRTRKSEDRETTTACSGPSAWISDLTLWFFWGKGKASVTRQTDRQA